MTDFSDREAVDRQYERERAGNVSPSLIAAIVVGILVLVFVLQNGRDAPVRFLWIDWQMPVWLVIAVSLLVGALLAKLIGHLWRRRRGER